MRSNQSYPPGVDRVSLPCRVRKPEGTVDAYILERYWIEGQGWFAKITLEGGSMVGMRPTHQVPLDQVERISGVNYEAIKPRW